jgi:TRAP-type C4-dicarboxylate transport system substrate-binding protein
MAIALASAAMSAQSQDAKPGNPNELKLSAAVGPAYALGAAGAQWAKRITEKSNGRLPAKLFPGATLSQRDAAREFVALRDGAADLAVGSSLYWSAYAPSLGVIGLPWLAPEASQLAALTRGPVADVLLASVDRAGAVPLALAPLGHREIASRERSIRVPADLAGLKVRVTGVPLITTLYATFGAQPLTMAFTDSQAAFAPANSTCRTEHRQHSRALISKRWASSRSCCGVLWPRSRYSPSIVSAGTRSANPTGIAA